MTANASQIAESLRYVDQRIGEKGEVLAAFAAHENEVTAGYKAK
jgi:hypothetical protein